MKQKNEKQTFSARDIAFTGLFAAVTAVLSQTAIPMPSGVPVTLQTFAVSFAGYFLGKRNAFMSVLIYLLVGAVGMPVFANFKGGIAALTGVTGGFLTGFLFMALLCGIGSESSNRALKIFFGMAGIAALHFCGVLQFSLITKSSFFQSFLTVSAPYLVKDAVSVMIAYTLGVEVKKRIPAFSGKM